MVKALCRCCLKYPLNSLTTMWSTLLEYFISFVVSFYNTTQVYKSRNLTNSGLRNYVFQVFVITCQSAISGRGNYVTGRNNGDPASVNDVIDREKVIADMVKNVAECENFIDDRVNVIAGWENFIVERKCGCCEGTSRLPTKKKNKCF